MGRARQLNGRVDGPLGSGRGHLQSQIGYKIKLNMPGLKGEIVETLYKRGADWLAGGAL